ncbi:MAG: sigma-54-dependent Fis family transcriptional regulator, partial [Acidobacteria bacterium]
MLVVDDDESIRDLVALWLGRAGYDLELFPDGETCLTALARSLPDCICLDLHLPGLSGIQILQRIKAHHPRLPVIMLTADTTVDTVVAAMQGGAYDYLVKPLDRTRLIATVGNAVERHQLEVRVTQLEREIDGRGYAGMVALSPAMRRMFRDMDRVAASDITVLVHGDSGTGKELVARGLHEASGRRDGPFVAVNCAAIPDTLEASEFFGHEKGAFTGANQRRVGRIEQADGGTLFLDEVGELSLGLQAKLLRVLQERRFQRVGGNVEIESDFRLIAATHRDLEEEVRAGRFREDLFFRIVVFELEVPPLRERGDDIQLLAQHFLAEADGQQGGQPPQLAPDALAALKAYPWPGNVRELQNAMEHARLVASDKVIRLADLPQRILAGREFRPPPADDAAAGNGAAAAAGGIAA